MAKIVKFSFLILIPFTHFSPPATADTVGKTPPPAVAGQVNDSVGWPGNMHQVDKYWPVMNNADGKNDQWKSVGAMIPSGDGKYTCTLTIVEPPGDCPLDLDRPALALAAGHCADLAESEDNVIRNKPFHQKVLFNHFADTDSDPSKEITAEVKEIVYATMRGSDLAVFKMGVTYRDLMKIGIKPRKIAHSPLARGTKLTNVACPTEIDSDYNVMRSATCSASGNVDVVEGPFVWPKAHEFRMDCPAAGGASGSGLFTDNGELAGVVNTTSIGSTPGACQLNSPCEINGGKSAMAKAWTYGADVSFLHKCVAKSCDIDVTQSGCPLAANNGPAPAVPTLTNSFDKPIPVTKEGGAQVKFGLAGQTDCADPSGYSAVKDLGEGAQFTPPTGKYPDGTYVVCTRTKGPDGQWQDVKDAAVRPLRLDATAPVAKVEESHTNGHTLYVAKLSDPDDGKGQLLSKVISSGSCTNDTQAYAKPLLGYMVDIKKMDSGCICLLGTDDAGNKQAVPTAYGFGGQKDCH